MRKSLSFIVQLVTVFLLVVASTLSSLYAVVYPGGVPSGEVVGGTFNTYFSNMFSASGITDSAPNYAIGCAVGQVMRGLSNTGMLLCVSPGLGVVSDSTLALSGELIGTENYVVKYDNFAGTGIGNSQIYDDGTNVGIATNTPGAKLEVAGQVKITGGGPANGRVLTSDATGLASWQMAPTPCVPGGAPIDNTCYGFESLLNNNTGRYNTANGYQSLYANTTGFWNQAFGYTSLYSNTTGLANTAVGMNSLTSNTDGSYNTAVGMNSLISNINGYQNSAIGEGSLSSNVAGAMSSANGAQALANMISGVYNTANGFMAGANLSSGNNNTALGANTNFADTTGSNQLNIANIIFGTGLTGTVGAPVGNIGIGVANPSAKLEVAGQIKITGGSPGIGKTLISDASGLATWTDSVSGSTATGIIGGTENYVSKFGSGGVGIYPSQIYDNATNVGIGTAVPGAKLEVAGQIKITGGVPGINKVLSSDASGLASWVSLSSVSGVWSLLGNSGTVSGTNFIGTTDGQDLVFKTNNAEVARILTSGNVGIGTAVPGAKLEVAGQIKVTGGTPGIGKTLISDAVGLATWGTPAVSNTVYATGVLAMSSSGGYVTKFMNAGSGITSSILFETGGKIGLGTINPAYMFDVQGSGSIIRAGSGMCIGTGCIYDWSDLSNIVKSMGTPHYLAKFNSGGFIDNSQVYETGGKLYIGDISSILGGGATIANVTVKAFGSTNSSNPLLTLSENGAQECRMWLNGANKIGSNCAWTAGTSGFGLQPNQIPRADTTGDVLTGSNMYQVGNNVGIGISSGLAANLHVSGSTLVTGNLTVQGKVITDTIINRTVNNISISGSLLPDAAAPLIYRNIGSSAQKWNNLYLSGQVTIAGGTPGLGKVLVSDATGLASWSSTISGATATGIVGGTQNYIPKFGTGGNGLYLSQFFDNGTNIGIGTTTPGAKLEVAGNLKINGTVQITGGAPYSGAVLLSDSGGIARWADPGTLGVGGVNFVGSTDYGSINIVSNAPDFTDMIFQLADNAVDGGDRFIFQQDDWSSPSLQRYPLVMNGLYAAFGPVYSLNFPSSARNYAAGSMLSSTMYINYTNKNIGIGTNTPSASAKLEVAGQVKITGGTPGLGKVLVSDATGLASWSSTISGATATGIVGGTQNYIPKFGTGGNGLYLSQFFDNGTNIGIGTASPTTKLTIDSGIAGTGGLRFTRINSTTTPYAGTSVGLGVDSSGNVVPVSNGDVVVYTGIGRNGTTPSPNPDIPNREISYDFNKYFAIPTKQSFVVSDGNGAGYNAPYFKENGTSGVCSWNGAGGSSPYDCAVADPQTGLSASPNNSFTMTARGDNYGYQLALGARGDAPLFARSGKWYNSTTNYASGLYLSDGLTPTPWQKVLTVPANHLEYFYVNIGYNSQLQAISGGGNVGIGTSFPDRRLVIASSGSTTSASPQLQIKRGIQGADANLGIAYGTPYINIGGLETRTNSLQTIAFGYSSLSGTVRYAPAEIGFLTTSTTGNTQGDIVFANRNGTTNVAPTEVMRIKNSGNVGIGVINPTQQLQISKSMSIPATNGASTGVIYKGATRFIHDYTSSPISPNLFIGPNAGNFTMTQGYNVGIGDSALMDNTSGFSNMAIGYLALSSNTTGGNNAAIGSESLELNISGNNNVANGFKSLYANLTGGNNTSIGTESLTANDIGSNNTANGYQSLYSNTSGNYNIAIGGQSLFTNISGQNNTAVGYQSLRLANSPSNNTALGYLAGNAITTGASNIVIGANAQVGSPTGSNQLSIGNWLYGSGGNIGIGIATPTAKLEVAGNFKLGTNGTVTTAAGVCTIAASVITTTATVKTCTGVPASTAVAVNCTAAAAFTTPNTTSLYCRANGTLNQVVCNTTVANAVSTTYKCMWMQ